MDSNQTQSPGSSSESILTESDQEEKNYDPSDYCVHCKENEENGRSTVSVKSIKENRDEKEFHKSASFPLAHAVTTRENKKDDGAIKVCVALQKEIKKKKKVKKRISAICTVNCKFEIVRTIALKFSMRDVKVSDDWDVYWTDYNLSSERAKDLKNYQKINHFPGMNDICRKDLLARNLNRMLKLFPDDYKIFPKTWCLPSDLVELISYSKLHPDKTYILKPDTGCRGNGIFLTKRIADIKAYEKMICQLYLAKPLTIDGFKFDLRIYTLITSCDPLRVYVYNEGLARFATTEYKEPTDGNTRNVYMHLTNYSLNKHSRFYVADNEIGSKRRLSTLNQALERDSYDVKKIWRKIDEVIVKTIIAAYPTLKHQYRSCFPNHEHVAACFELLGFDIIIDTKLTPYVLEVNHSPSFHTDRPIDREIKEALLTDTFRILNLAKSYKSRVMKEEKRKLDEKVLSSLGVGNPPESKGYNAHYLAQRQAYNEQVEWEEANLGNYRKVYPSHDSYRYEPFFNQDETRLYSGTATARHREEINKALRDEAKNKEEKEKVLRETDRRNRELIKKFEERKLEMERREKEKLQKEKEERERRKAAAQKEMAEKAEKLNFHKEEPHMRKEAAYIKNEIKVSDYRKEQPKAESQFMNLQKIHAMTQVQNVFRPTEPLDLFQIRSSKSVRQEQPKPELVIVPQQKSHSTTPAQNAVRPSTPQSKTAKDVPAKKAEPNEQSKVERIIVQPQTTQSNTSGQNAVRTPTSPVRTVKEQPKAERRNASPQKSSPTSPTQSIHRPPSSQIKFVKEQPKVERRNVSPKKSNTQSPNRSPSPPSRNNQSPKQLNPVSPKRTSPQRASKPNENTKVETDATKVPSKINGPTVTEIEAANREAAKAIIYGKKSTHSTSESPKHISQKNSIIQKISIDQKRSPERYAGSNIRVSARSSRTSQRDSLNSIPLRPANDKQKVLYKLLLQIGGERRLDKLIKATKLYEPYNDKPNIKEIFN